MANAQKSKRASGSEAVTSGWAKNRQHRRERLLEFLPLILPLIDEAGGVAAFAESIGRTGATDESWLQFEYLPKPETICKIAEVYGADLSELLEAAGRPPIAELRHSMARNERQTLPAMLRAFRDERGAGDTTRAAELVGITRFTYSRFVAGSARPGPKHVVLLGKALGVSEDEILDACAYGLEDATRKNLARRGASDARFVQKVVSELMGLDPWDTDDLRQAAWQVRFDVVRMRNLVKGSGRLTVPECVQICAKTGASLVEALTATGISKPESRTLAKALVNPAPTRSGLQTACGDLLYAYRITGNLTLASIAERAGICGGRAVVAYEQGIIPNPTTLVRLAKALNAPLNRLVRPAGFLG